MAVKTRALRKVRSLKKAGISDEICIKVLLELTVDERDTQSVVDTILAFFEDERRELLNEIERIESEYHRHVEICTRERQGQSFGLGE